MLNARKSKEFVMFISRLFLRYPREAFCLLMYEYNLSMAVLLKIPICMEGEGGSSFFFLFFFF